MKSRTATRRWRQAPKKRPALLDPADVTPRQAAEVEPVEAPAPKPEVQKPVTEAATAARQAQKDKASKAAGINASVYTSPLNRADATQKTLLGQ